MILLDEIHVLIRVPGELNEVEVNKIRRTLLGKPFMKRLRSAIKSTIASSAPLAPVRIELDR
jgi:hypothetical protein